MLEAQRAANCQIDCLRVVGDIRLAQQHLADPAGCSAALLLALVGDQVAAKVAAGDPVSSVRAAVAAMQDRIR